MREPKAVRSLRAESLRVGPTDPYARQKERKRDREREERERERRRVKHKHHTFTPLKQPVKGGRALVPGGLNSPLKPGRRERDRERATKRPEGGF